MKKTGFALSFTAGGLLYNESITVAETWLKNEGDWSLALHEIKANNLLQSRTASTATRKLREIAQRLKLLTTEQMKLLVEGTRLEQKLLLWLACCLKYPLLAELARDVVRAKFLQLDYAIDAGDVSRFLDMQSVWHEELEGLTESTTTKLQTVMLRMLREAELVSDAGIITAPLVSDRFVQSLRHSPSHSLFFPLVLENRGAN